MSEPIKIELEKKQPQHIEINGNIWEVKPMSARFGTKLSRVGRKLPVLGEKLEKGTATQEEEDKADEYLDFLLDALPKLISDGTPDNKDVKAWADDLTFEGISVVLAKVMEALNEAANDS